MVQQVRVSAWAYRAQVLVATIIGCALVLRFTLTTFWPDPEPDTPALLVRWVRFLSYFTIQSNIVALIASIMVIRRVDLGTPWMRSLRLIAMVGVSVTGVVYALILAKDDHYTGIDWVANFLLHYLSPWSAVLLWACFGPWPKLSFGDIPRALVWPVAWIVYTLIHGAITDWWPYGFIDVPAEGGVQVAINIVAIFVFALALSSLYIGVARLRRRMSGEEDAAGQQGGVASSVDADTGDGSAVG